MAKTPCGPLPQPEPVKKHALRFDLARFWAVVSVIASPILSAQPLPTLNFAWDYPPTNTADGFLLLRGGALAAPPIPKTERTAATAVGPGLHTFTVAATNAGGAATSAPVQVRVLRVILEKSASPAGPWTADEALFKTWQSGPSNQFFRARLDLQ